MTDIIIPKNIDFPPESPCIVKLSGKYRTLSDFGYWKKNWIGAINIQAWLRQFVWIRHQNVLHALYEKGWTIGTGTKIVVTDVHTDPTAYSISHIKFNQI
jgi:hypothetical protein